MASTAVVDSYSQAIRRGHRSLVLGHRQSRANAATDAATPSAGLTLRPQPTVSDQSGHSEQQQRRAAPAPAPEGEPRRAIPTSGLPSFAYNRSVRHNVTSGGSEEAATCSDGTAAHPPQDGGGLICTQVFRMAAMASTENQLLTFLPLARKNSC
ncbi:unnamed protein product [Miscanthus lutarioriparius]|uniref:Uncharacterized protein n=1 Tax=Miscanthus lutarioriparius TaxID=422564 RepID=A0A811S2X7_9POAL|nr:unnamed protein product [Miscanthus lutarioriparius]